MMRLLAVFIASWGLIGVPTLCQAGIFVECCEDACPDESESSQPCQCSSCLELCNAAVWLTEQNGRPNIDHIVPAANVATTPSTVRRETVHEGSPVWLAHLIREHFPYPIPDRPLLV